MPIVGQQPRPIQAVCITDVNLIAFLVINQLIRESSLCVHGGFNKPKRLGSVLELKKTGGIRCFEKVVEILQSLYLMLSKLCV